MRTSDISTSAINTKFHEIVDLTISLVGIKDNNEPQRLRSILNKLDTLKERAEYCVTIAKHKKKTEFKTEKLKQTRSDIREGISAGRHEYVLNNDPYRLQLNRFKRGGFVNSRRIVDRIIKMAVDIGLIKSNKQKHLKRREQYYKEKIAGWINN